MINRAKLSIGVVVSLLTDIADDHANVRQPTV